MSDPSSMWAWSLPPRCPLAWFSTTVASTMKTILSRLSSRTLEEPSTSSSPPVGVGAKKATPKRKNHWPWLGKTKSPFQTETSTGSTSSTSTRLQPFQVRFKGVILNPWSLWMAVEIFNLACVMHIEILFGDMPTAVQFSNLADFLANLRLLDINLIKKDKPIS